MLDVIVNASDVMGLDNKAVLTRCQVKSFFGDFLIEIEGSKQPRLHGWE